MATEKGSVEQAMAQAAETLRTCCGHHAVDGATDSQQRIIDVCTRLRAMLLQKNRRYGDSALNPMRVFSKADTLEQMRVRMDDKLSRIAMGAADDDEDPIWDLAGYLVLYLAAREVSTGR